MTLSSDRSARAIENAKSIRICPSVTPVKKRCNCDFGKWVLTPSPRQPYSDQLCFALHRTFETDGATQGFSGRLLDSKGGEPMEKYNRDQKCWSRGEVSDARLHQRSGPQHAFGGWEKVRNGDGSYWMRETHR